MKDNLSLILLVVLLEKEASKNIKSSKFIKANVKSFRSSDISYIAARLLFFYIMLVYKSISNNGR